MELDRLTFNQYRLERLDSQPMEGGGAIEQYRMFADDFVEDIPDVLALFFHHLFGALDGGDIALLFKLAVDERLEQFQRHLLGQSALMEPKFWTHHNDRPPRVIDPLAEQVLPKAPRLALEHVGQGFKRTLGWASNRTPAAAIIEQCIHRFLQHTLF